MKKDDKNSLFFLMCAHREEVNGYIDFCAEIYARNKPDAIKKVKEEFGENIIIKKVEKRSSK